MELHQLRYALAVVDHGTFTAAAEACFVAQPSLSHAIRTLERELGVELFARIGRRTVLTAAGEAFVPPAREALRALDTLRADVDAVGGVVAGHLDLVALPTLAVEPVTPLVGAFRVQHPGVTIRLAHPEGTDELVELVRSGDSELGITELPVTAARITTMPLGRQELVAILPPTQAPGRASTSRRWPSAPSSPSARAPPPGTRSTPRSPPWAPPPPSRSRPISGRPSCPSCWPAQAPRSCPGRWRRWPRSRARSSRRSGRRCTGSSG